MSRSWPVHFTCWLPKICRHFAGRLSDCQCLLNTSAAADPSVQLSRRMPKIASPLHVLRHCSRQHLYMRPAGAQAARSPVSAHSYFKKFDILLTQDCSGSVPGFRVPELKMLLPCLLDIFSGDNHVYGRITSPPLCRLKMPEVFSCQGRGGTCSVIVTTYGQKHGDDYLSYYLACLAAIFPSRQFCGLPLQPRLGGSRHL